MAKKIFKPRLHDSGTIITTKTAFGSTSDMIVDHNMYLLDNNEVCLNDNEIICKDDHGFYKTIKSRIDTGIADPNRYANPKNRMDLIEKEQNSSS